MSNTLFKILRALAVVLLGFIVAFTALGAVGTACVAWGAEKWGPFAVLAPLKGVYQILVYVNLAAALGGIVVTYAVLRGEKWSYVGSIITLVVFIATAAVQMYITSMLRQVSFFSTPPTSIRLYMTVIVFAFFLVFRVPRIRGKAGFVNPAGGTGSSKAPVGLSLAVMGLTALTTLFWAGPSHTVDGHNLVRVLESPLTFGGGALLLTGVSLLALASLPTRSQLLSPSLQDIPFASWFKRKRP